MRSAPPCRPGARPACARSTTSCACSGPPTATWPPSGLRLPRRARRRLRQRAPARDRPAIKRQLIRYERAYMADAEVLRRSAAMHDEIVDHLARGRPRAAAIVVEENFRSALPALLGPPGGRRVSRERWAAVDRYVASGSSAPDPALDDGAARRTRRRAAGDRRVAAAGQVPAAAGPLQRRAADPRDRHARRLQHDLAGPGAARRRAPGDARGRPAPRRGRRGQPRPRRRRGRASRSASARRSTRCRGSQPRRRGAVRPRRSSTPTRRGRPTTSRGRCGSRGRAASSSPTTSCATARLADAEQRRAGVVGGRRLHEPRSPPSPRLTATTIQTVGAKGYDGFTIALVGARGPRGPARAVRNRSPMIGHAGAGRPRRARRRRRRAGGAGRRRRRPARPTRRRAARR